MYRIICYQALFCLLLSACLKKAATQTVLPAGQAFETTTDSLNLFDVARKRAIPVALYFPKPGQVVAHPKVVIFSHGYSENQLGANTSYTYLTENLAAQGYFVASIQHELPTDSLLSMTPPYQVTRRPAWERGAANILFVINELKRLKPELDFKHLTLIGHSNGGDMSMLFARQHPELVDKAISLDNKRMPLPRASRPQVCTLRADDDPADPGVLPTPEEQKRFGASIIYLKGIKHVDMSGYGNAAQHAEINKYIEAFLKE